MIMTSSIPEFAIIADDLTGSLDTGLQFRKQGLTTVVPLCLARPWPKAQALVLNTDSRNISGDVAYQKVYKACRNLKSRALYKKIDSTLRGNVGMEISAILDAQKIPQAIIVPTVPEQGRTVERGILRVNGVPLLRTSYARDPFHPLWTSRIADLLQKEVGQPVGHIALKEVRKDAAHLAKRIERSPERLLVVDAVLQSDLQAIASGWKLLSGRALACGSVGLAVELGVPRERGKEKGICFSKAPFDYLGQPEFQDCRANRGGTATSLLLFIGTKPPLSHQPPMGRKGGWLPYGFPAKKSVHWPRGHPHHHIPKAFSGERTCDSRSSGESDRPPSSERYAWAG